MTDTTNSNPIFSWLSETINRIFLKSPAYFKVWNIILSLLVLVPQIPNLLAAFGITIPAEFNGPVNKIISIAAFVGLFISKLTVKDPTAVIADPTKVSLKYTQQKS